jgi:hypothetical protein
MPNRGGQVAGSSPVAHLHARSLDRQIICGEWQTRRVPRISSFYGIVIAMYYDEHGRPHFHAHYAERKASIAIDTLEVLGGSLPRRALGFVREWAEQHRDELDANWERARDEEPLEPIEPLT